MVQLYALVVVDVEVLLLSAGKHSLVLEEADVANHLFRLELAHKVLVLPVDHGHMTPLAGHKQVAAIATIVHTCVRPKVS